MDVLAVPSLWHENTPLVIHSAQALRLPVIAADVGGISEVVADEENGLLFEKGNANQVASIIQRLCRKPEILGRLSAGARPPLSMKAYADRIEKTYLELVES
jgi:glycosyltransferase involved in cell wall biosynthesis